jgi:hypothetical protein
MSSFLVFWLNDEHFFLVCVGGMGGRWGGINVSAMAHTVSSMNAMLTSAGKRGLPEYARATESANVSVAGINIYIYRLTLYCVLVLLFMLTLEHVFVVVEYVLPALPPPKHLGGRDSVSSAASPMVSPQSGGSDVDNPFDGVGSNAAASKKVKFTPSFFFFIFFFS